MGSAHRTTLDVSQLDARPERGSVGATTEGVGFAGVAEFEAWLEVHWRERAGVWLKLAKKGTGIASLSSDEAVDVGLCFGWISGQRKPFDERYYVQKYVPRRPRSRWSRVNVDKVEALLAVGKLRPSGLAEVAAAKADGRWAAAYASQKQATRPDDLVAALAVQPAALRAFEALGKTRQYALILKLLTARTTKARASQLRRVLASLEAGQYAG
jgi:uncharacterized protein YdeI (YjbR/CyaY-like superfamily)